MCKVLLLLGFVVWPFSAHAAVLFEGYFRIESHGKHIGYVVQRDEVGDKSKQRTLTYLVWKSEDGRVTQDAVKVVAKPASARNLYASVSFKHWQGADRLTDVTEGKFGKLLTIVQRNLNTGASVQRGSMLIPPEAIFSSMATQIFAEKALGKYATGQSMSFDALSEEDEKYSNLRLDVLDSKTFGDQKIVQVVSHFLSESIELFTFEDGQPIGSRNDVAGIETFLVSRHEDAFGTFKSATESIELVFEAVPRGLKTPASTSKPKLSVSEVLQSFPLSRKHQ
jgi:hypothetical protein